MAKKQEEPVGDQKFSNQFNFRIGADLNKRLRIAATKCKEDPSDLLRWAAEALVEYFEAVGEFPRDMQIVQRRISAPAQFIAAENPAPYHTEPGPAKAAGPPTPPGKAERTPRRRAS